MIKAALIATGGLVGTACYLHGAHILEHLQAFAGYL
jgi:hypothetical protein